MKKLSYIILISFSLLIPHIASASLEAEVYTLKNEMKVVLIPNHKAPVISHMVWYRVGAQDEPRGKSGLAHFLEHLLFKGTAKNGPGEFSRKISQFGGVNNAFTSQDFTVYYENIAKEKLELVMDLESDRMENLLFLEDIIEKERQVILEERNMRIENNPTALLGEKMRATLFQNHPYGIPIIGWKHEIETLSLEDIRNFYLQNYAPNNATLVISGDIDINKVKPLIEKYYEGIRPADIQPRTQIKEPPHLAKRTLTLSHPNVQNERFFRYYIAPSVISKEDENIYAISLLSRLLGESITSTLYTELVEKQKIAVAVNSYFDDLAKGPSVFSVSATPAPGVSLDRLEKAIDNILTNVQKNGFDNEMIERNKELMIADTIYAQEDLKTLAYIYGQVISLGLPTTYVTEWADHIRKLGNNEIKRAAQQVFQPIHSVTGYLLPKPTSLNTQQ